MIVHDIGVVPEIAVRPRQREGRRSPSYRLLLNALLEKEDGRED
jgi:hypothetical protein